MFKKSDDAFSEQMREMYEDEFEELMDAAHRAISAGYKDAELTCIRKSVEGIATTSGNCRMVQ